MDPQEYAVRRYPLSDIERAVGELRPIVSIFTGFWNFSFLSTLNRPSVVAKKKI
jgi:hypothetical protein